MHLIEFESRFEPCFFRENLNPDYASSQEFSRLFLNIKCETNVISFKAAKEYNVSLFWANSIVADKNRAWQLFGTDSQTARAGLGDLLTGFIAGCSAIDLTYFKKIKPIFWQICFTFIRCIKVKWSNASAIGDELSKLIRNRKMRQISWKKKLMSYF